MTETPTTQTRNSGRYRWLRRALIGLALIVLLLGLTAVGGFHWLTRTESGAGFALEQARGAVPGLDWSSAEGNIRDGLRLVDLRFEQNGLSVRADRAELAVRIRLFGGILVTVDRLRVDGAEITLPPSAPDAAGEPLSIPDLGSPVPIEIVAVQLNGIRVRARADEPPLAEVDELRLAGRLHETLELREFALRMPQGQLDASGDIGLNAPHRLALDLEARTTLTDLPEHRVELTIRGPLGDLELELETHGPARLAGPLRLRGLPELDRISAELQGEFADWPDLDYAVRDLQVAMDGGRQDWNARISARAEGPGLPDNQIQIDATGSLTAARLETLRIRTLDGEILARGRADWSAATEAEMNIRLEQLDLSTLYPQLPAQARLDGTLDLSLAGETLTLESLALRAPPTTLSVVGNGRYDPASDDLALDLIWQDFSWPPVTDESEPLVASERGEIQLSGRLSDWRAELGALLQVPEQPQTEIRASIQGGRAGALIESMQFDAAQTGRARLDGEIRWQPEFRGRLSAELIDLDPAEFVRQLPGEVSARVDIELKSADRFTLDILQLDGRLRGQPLSGSGRVRWQANAPEAGELRIALGDNQLILDSADGERWAFRAQGPALDQLWPGLSGVLDAEGEVIPARAELSARATLRDGGLDDVTLRGLDLRAELRWREPTRADVVLTLEDLDLNPWERVDRLELTLDGRCRDHRFALNVNAQRASLDLAGRGQWLNCLRGGERWDGAVERLFIGDTPAGDWQLDQALQLAFQPQLVELGPACLQPAGSNPGAVCLRQAQLTPAGQSSLASLSLDEVPMDLVLLPLDPTVSVGSRLSGELQARWTLGAGLDRLGGFLELSAGDIVALGAEQALLSIDGIRLDLTPDNGGVLAELDGRFEGQSRLSGAIGIEDLRAPQQSTINGSMELNLPDINAFNRAVPELDEIRGRLEGAMAIRGRLGAPQLEGEARLVDAAIQHAPLGVDIEDIQLTVTGSNLEASLSGRMRAGDGQLELVGGLSPGGQFWRWELTTRGEDFQLTNADWLQLTISPQIRLNGEGRQMRIDGDVGIDRLQAGLPPGRAARIDASDDVVVLGETDAEARPAPLTMTGRLGIDLGENSRLVAVGLETRLAGQVELQWDESGALPRSRGIIQLPEGSYQAYGQNLEIEGGEIVLSNQPVTNPRLDIEAVREIFGDPQVERAGVSIRGNAQTPEIQLFTDPPTSEEKALAYVLTGADFDHAGGQGAVNVGLYLLPKLFVSYGIGLFESGNVLSGRYELSRRWGVRVVSGERDTGVDLSYAVDR
jgi:translocation and assembly module TamB